MPKSNNRGAKHEHRSDVARSPLAGTPLLERLLAVMGALLLGSGVAFLVHDGLTRDDEPGGITIHVDEIRAAAGDYVARFTIHNGGGETLSQLHLTARLMDGDAEIESARASVDYLPGHAKQEGGFYFDHDPRRYVLSIRPEGYVEP